MFEVLFVCGTRNIADEIKRNGVYRYVALCRSNGGTWTRKDKKVKCVLQSFNFDVTNTGDFNLFLHMVNSNACKGYGGVFAVNNCKECSCSSPFEGRASGANDDDVGPGILKRRSGSGGSTGECTCTLSTCPLCITVKRRKLADKSDNACDESWSS